MRIAHHFHKLQRSGLLSLKRFIKETQLVIGDRGEEKWWAKKWKTWGSCLYFSAHHFLPLQMHYRHLGRRQDAVER